MKKTDARALSHETLEALRMRAVQRVDAGESPETVARAIGVNRSAMYRWLKDFRTSGVAALKAKPIPGRPPRLDEKQRRWLHKTIVDKTPEQLRFPFALWTLAIVKEVIARQFSVKLSVRQISRILHDLGLTPQRPLYRAWQRDPKRVRQWLNKEYPAIRTAAKRAGAEIFFGDEAGVRTDHHAGTTWGKKGVTPVVTASGDRHSLSMISAISPRGVMRFMVYKKKLGAALFIVFLRRLMKGMKRPVYLIVDGLRSHSAKMVQRFVVEQDGMLKLFYLPPYSPHLNAQEYAWNPLKRKIKRQTPVNDIDLRDKMHGSLRSMQRRPKHVRSFFQAPDTSYAA
jgi:transposase